ncbi:MAG: uncharacterized protein RLZZ225_324 [Pseudomonadota bacterium]|jgi:SepF-like predicted cell division protein (DUF552 family)
MREYGSVQTQFWSDLALQNLSTHAKLLAVYLLTGPHTTMLGCFRLPAGYVAEDLKWEVETVCNTFKELTQIGFLIRDTESNWVLITHFLTWNPIENPNQGKSLSKLFNRVPPQATVFKPLIKILLTQRYLEQGFENRLGALCQPLQNQEQDQNQKQKQDQYQEKNQKQDDDVGKPSVDDLPSSNNKPKNPLVIIKKREIDSSTNEEIITVPLQSGGVFIINTADINSWKKTYPDIDILQELRQLRAWNEANPTERKTRSQILRHINAWLAKEQRTCLQRQQSPPVNRANHLALHGLSPTLEHNIIVGEQWLNCSTNSEEKR